MVETKKETDKLSWWGVVIGVLVWLTGLSWFGLSWNRLPPEMPLFYSLPRGEQQLVSKGWFLVVLLISGVVFGFNLLLASWIAKEEALLRRFLIWGGVTVLMLLLMTTARIMLIIL